MDKDYEKIPLSTILRSEEDNKEPFVIIKKGDFEELQDKGKYNTLYFITEEQNE